jgi:hypothetical protein
MRPYKPHLAYPTISSNTINRLDDGGLWEVTMLHKGDPPDEMDLIPQAARHLVGFNRLPGNEPGN